MQEEVQIKQLRFFGLMLVGLVTVIGLWPTLFRSEAPRLWLLSLGILLLSAVLLTPRRLGPFYRIWMAIGYFLGRINTGIMLTLVFYGMITPVGFVMQLLGRDPMHRRFESGADSYRVVRQPRPSSHMSRQF